MTMTMIKVKFSQKLGWMAEIEGVCGTLHPHSLEFTPVPLDQVKKRSPWGNPYGWQEFKDLAAFKSAKTDSEKSKVAEIEREEAELMQQGVVPATIENLRILMRYLNRRNWGSWELPKFEISYKASQFDCDGVIATTVTLEKPIEGSTKFVYNAPRGHLGAYTRV